MSKLHISAIGETIGIDNLCLLHGQIGICKLLSGLSSKHPHGLQRVVQFKGSISLSKDKLAELREMNSVPGSGASLYANSQHDLMR